VPTTLFPPARPGLDWEERKGRRKAHLRLLVALLESNRVRDILSDRCTRPERRRLGDAGPEQMGNRQMSTAQRSTPGAFERHATTMWRSVRRYLPDRVAEAIRIPARRALRALGLIREA
jgi:hypothetical protein